MAQIEVTVLEARNLKKKDTLTENDPYVQIYLDDKKQIQRTSTKQNCRTPRWNQTLVLYFIERDSQWLIFVDSIKFFIHRF